MLQHMLDQEITQQDARRLAALARNKSDRWRMMAEELEMMYGPSVDRPPPVPERTEPSLTSADIRGVLGEGVSKRKSQIADVLRVPISAIEPFLTLEHGIEVNQQGWVRITNNGEESSHDT